MKTIKILGAGIAGLTAAINLKIAGFDVEVHERKKFCGKRIKDFEFLENWMFKDNILKFLKSINIKTEFYMKPYHKLEVFSPSSDKFVGLSREPFMYLIKRGHLKDSIDSSLERQAKKLKIKIKYNSKIKHSEANIISTGPHKSTWTAFGIKFKCNLPDNAAVILDNTLSNTAYSYIVINNKIGEITSCNPVGTKDLKKRLETTIKRFEKIYSIKVKKKEYFAGGVDFHFSLKENINNQLYIGEAAGFQDNLAGFGMGYAFRSGYLAAKSIIKKKDYDKLWKKEFLKQLKISYYNRKIYNKLNNKRYEKIITIFRKNSLLKKLAGGDDFRKVLKKAYNTSISRIFYPIIR